MEHRVIRSRVLIAVIIVGSVFILTAGAALAAGSAGVSPSRVHEANDGPGGVSSPYVTSGIGGGEHVTGSLMISLCITTVFTDVSPDVFTLRSEGYGFGEVVMAYFLAREGDCGEGSCDVDDILEMRQLPMGWGEIFKEVYGSASHRDLNLGQIISGHLMTDTLSVAAQRLAERVGTTDEQAVQDLLDQGAGYGTIIVAYKLADEFGVTPEWLVGERLAGAGWGQIKRGLSSSALTTTESQEGPPDDAGPPDNAGPKDHPDHPDHPDRPDNAGPKDNNKKSK